MAILLPLLSLIAAGAAAAIPLGSRRDGVSWLSRDFWSR